MNLRGVLNCTYAALPGMQEAGYGRIVSIASEAGRVGSKGSAVYSAAKGGVIAFTKVMARENARFGITANAIAPGPIETPLLMEAKEFGEIGEKIIENMKAGTQMKRLGQPEEVAAAVAFLCSGRFLLRHRRVHRRLRRHGDGGLMALEIGAERTDEFVVEGRLITDVGGTIGASVLSTPGMIGMMERTAAVLSFEQLAEGKATVGFEVCVKHVAAAAEGQTCTVTGEAPRGRRRPQAPLRRRGQGGRPHDRRRHPRAPRDRDRPSPACS